MPFIEVNHLKMFYYDNELEGIPIMFIHGWLGNSLEWSHQLFYFSKKKHVILLDLPGFGKSDKPKTDYSIDFFTTQIKDFINILGYKHAIVIGHSMGGLIALNLSIKYPNLVQKLVLISASASLSISIKDKFMNFIVNLVFKFNYKNFLSSVITRILSPTKNKREFKKLYNDTLKLPQFVVLKTFRNMTSFNVNKKLKNLSQPVLILHGTDDKIISEGMINKMANLISKSKLISIQKGSHRIMYYNFLEVNNLIDKFID